MLLILRRLQFNNCGENQKGKTNLKQKPLSDCDKLSRCYFLVDPIDASMQSCLHLTSLVGAILNDGLLLKSIVETRRLLDTAGSGQLVLPFLVSSCKITVTGHSVLSEQVFDLSALTV